MESLLHDLRYGLRLLGRSPGFTTVAIVTLALGIGANTAIFSVVNGVLLRPAPVAEIERLAMVWETDRNSGTTREPASVPDYFDFVERSRSFEALAAVSGAEVTLSPPGGEPARLAALVVTHGFLPMLGIPTIAGRGFSSDEDRPGGPDVVLISEALWERSFGRDPGLVGGTVQLNDRPYTVIGVVPDTADFGVLQVLSAAAYSRSFADRGDRQRVDAWVPARADAVSLPRDTHPIFVVGRLMAGVNPAAAQDEMTAIAADLERQYEVNGGRGVFVEPMADVVFGRVQPALYVLLVAVGLVLLIACVNVANLLLARGMGRSREVAIRLALGAGGGRLARQFLVEGLLLSLLAMAAGVGLAAFGLDALVALAPPEVPRLDTVSIDLSVLGVTVGVSLLLGVGFGLTPLLLARRVNPQSALKGDGGTVASPRSGRSRAQRALVVAELSLAVVLVVGAGLLTRSFWNLHQVDAGFEPEGVVKVEFQLPRSRYPADFSVWPNFREIHAFTHAVLERVEALPGVEAATVAGNHPLDPGFTNSFSIAGREAEARGWPEISVRRVTPGYFRTVGLALGAGRLLEASDATDTPPVLLINATAAKRFFPDQEPIGERIVLWGAARSIVGVIADEKVHGLDRAAPPAVYLPHAQAPIVNGAGVLLVRTRGDLEAQIPAIRHAVTAVDPALAVFGAEPLDGTVGRSVGRQRFTMTLLALFAATALALAMVGIAGVLWVSVAQRTREFGIRMALGAPAGDILRLVLGEGMRLTVLGVGLGLVAAAGLTRLLAALLFGVSATDPLTFVAVVALLVGTSLLACAIPASRAAGLEPMAALRRE